MSGHCNHDVQWNPWPENPHRGWQIEAEAENDTKESNTICRKLKTFFFKAAMHLLYFICTHTHTHTHIVHHTHSLKGCQSPTSNGSLPFPELFANIQRARFDPLLLGQARRGGTLGGDRADRRETASYESVLIAPFIDSCLSGSPHSHWAKWLCGEPACSLKDVLKTQHWLSSRLRDSRLLLGAACWGFTLNPEGLSSERPVWVVFWHWPHWFHYPGVLHRTPRGHPLIPLSFHLYNTFYVLWYSGTLSQCCNNNAD